MVQSVVRAGSSGIETGREVIRDGPIRDGMACRSERCGSVRHVGRLDRACRGKSQGLVGDGWACHGGRLGPGSARIVARWGRVCLGRKCHWGEEGRVRYVIRTGPVQFGLSQGKVGDEKRRHVKRGGPECSGVVSRSVRKEEVRARDGIVWKVAGVGSAREERTRLVGGDGLFCPVPERVG